ncbi:MAG: GlxA family transcriptional regulator [Vitreoscilla sp.]|nr:GlxA family transcriptional regulator [Vitreoscilla sp.]
MSKLHQQRHKTQKIGFILLRGFTMITFASAVDVLRMSNYHSQNELYSWHIYQESDDICASNGLRLEHTCDMAGLFECDMVFVCAGIDVQTATTPAIKQLLQQLDQQGITLGGMCNGSVALALAKLLDGYRSAVHWESLPAAKEAFLQVKFGEQLYALDRNRYTCSGGTASMDMMLHIIRLQHGKALATAVSQQFVMERIRDDSTTQYKPHTDHIGPGYDYVHTAIELMQANLDEVLAMQEIADLIPLSLRQMERLFKRYCNMSPAQYYLRLRLQRAKELLAQTSMSVMQVTVACGFSTSSHFSKAYRSYYGYSPREQRKPSDPAFQFKIAGSGGVFNAFGR